METVFLHNPHSALAALQCRPEAVIGFNLPDVPLSDPWFQVKTLALTLRKKNLFLKSETNLKSSFRGAAHYLSVSEKKPIVLDALFCPSDAFRLIFACDQVQDPQNLGALFRSLAFFNVDGLLLLDKRSASLTGTVYDVASGGVETVPFSIAGNLRQALELAKKNGYWILGASEHAAISLKAVSRDRSWVVVMGNEQSGLRPLTQQVCDQLCQIPSGKSKIGSLNVAVAASVFAYHFSS